MNAPDWNFPIPCPHRWLAGWTLLACLLFTATLDAAEVDASPQVVVLAGTGESGSDGDRGPALKARLNQPFGLVRGPDRSLWFADFGAHVIRRIDPAGGITTEVGTGTEGYSGDGGPGTTATLKQPHEIRFDRDGRLYIADTGNHVIRRFDPRTRTIETFAGTGESGNSGDGGPARGARLKDPISLQFSPAGDLVIADVSSHVLRRVDRVTGLMSTLAGTGQAGKTPDGAPLAGTPLRGPRSLDFDAAGNLWLVTREGNQVLRLDLEAGQINWVAGTGAKGFTGDGADPRLATLSGPKGIAVGPDGTVYIADTENHAIRRIVPGAARMERFLGQSGGLATEKPAVATLNRPHGVYVDSDGTVLVGDSENHRILAVRRP